MAQKTIDIRELAQTLESRLEEVRDGASLLITEGGRPVARLVPAEASLEDKLQELVKAGVISWSGRKPSADIPTFPVQGPKTVAEMLIEDRD
jgi:prevent-host-death family protein